MSEKHTSTRDNALKLLKNRPYSVSFTQIAEGAGVTVGWLKAFSQGKIDNPGVNTIEALTSYLNEANNK